MNMMNVADYVVPAPVPHRIELALSLSLCLVNFLFDWMKLKFSKLGKRRKKMCSGWGWCRLWSDIAKLNNKHIQIKSQAFFFVEMFDSDQSELKVNRETSQHWQKETIWKLFRSLSECCVWLAGAKARVKPNRFHFENVKFYSLQ